jgi:hypothetical protein
MAHPVEDKLGLPILDRCVSTTGKYFCFYGVHYDSKDSCFDVGAVNTLTGEIVKRHYPDEKEASEFWETFRAQMQAPREGGIEDEPTGFVVITPD